MKGSIYEIAGVKVLASAIALQAIKDYREAYRSRKKALARRERFERKGPSIKQCKEIGTCNLIIAKREGEMREIEKWFNTPFAEEITGIPGERAIEELRKTLSKENVWGESSTLEGIDD